MVIRGSLSTNKSIAKLVSSYAEFPIVYTGNFSAI